MRTCQMVSSLSTFYASGVVIPENKPGIEVTY
ncbi:uncharacterized protein FFB20_13903 [Fusarium fujikuroi]|nr:uncharacterized protein FFE2_05065 [Fusarium fujikuroi]SCN84511.1 uncharacterized protein FFC1_04578 [Fusarium fujikuroi]SCN85030.1 uncharacterized protein FFM5_03556 [Fusarium fujikuroi]SCO11893.1 uncharacterized protein FFB20_13903 [Fusarium fujikuroi]SCO34590.1 uncharacterized protein FFNC_03923 [Fusarium fujikuroi]